MSESSETSAAFDDKVIVELKISKEYQPADEAQLLNELKATGIRVGLVINFGRSKVEFKRFIANSLGSSGNAGKIDRRHATSLPPFETLLCRGPYQV